MRTTSCARPANPGWRSIPSRSPANGSSPIAPIVRSAELGHGRAEVRYRFDRLTAELGLDRERARGWVFAQALAWGFGDDGELIPHHLEVARWV